jgi:hypothetical protein
MILAAASLGLAACGTDRRARVDGGAATGAAAGAETGALGSPLTIPDRANLGDPPWRNLEARPRLS